MIVYRTHARSVETAREIERLRSSLEAGPPAQDDITDLLISLGELEAGVIDALCPERDALSPTAAAFRSASLLAGRMFSDAARQRRPLAEALAALSALDLPKRVSVSTPEGYAYYALYPQAYREAARRYFRELRPERAAVIGIRSIGASLSAVAAAALEELGCAVRSWTVRPRGHPFERRLLLSRDFELAIRALGGWRFLIVDEGPGLSGSSMTSVAQKLSELGVPDRDIALFPSWAPDGANFLSEAARERWRRHRKYTASFEDVWPSYGALAELSAGRWRGLLYHADEDWPAVQPQHERRKYLSGGSVLLRFAGLGRYGRASLERARRLAEASFTPRPLELSNGFLASEFVKGRPLAGRRDATAGLLGAMARYLAHLRRHFGAAASVAFEDMLAMIRVNAEEGLGPEWARASAELETFRAAVAAAPAAALDGRMLPQEWIETARGYLKTDALDHHDDHFFPGCADIAWDVAGACIEFDLDAGQRAALIAAYSSLSGDRDLSERLPFYSVAYLAFRLGYATLARQAIPGSSDAHRFAALEARYAALLRQALTERPHGR